MSTFRNTDYNLFLSIASKKSTADLFFSKSEGYIVHKGSAA